MNPGIYPNITDDDYHASEGISNSGLVIIANRTPAHYLAQRETPREPTPALIDGKRIHRIVLEPERFASEFAVAPKFDMRKNVEKEAYAVWMTENAGRTPLTQQEYDKLHRIRDAVRQHPDAAPLLHSGRAEQSVYATDPETGAPVRCRPDFDPDALPELVDLKSTLDASEDSFMGSAFKYNYHQQAAFYCDVYEWATGNRREFAFIAVEKEPPYAVNVFRASPSLLSRGRQAYRTALDTYAECLRDNIWPAYPPGVKQLDIPVWAENMLQAKDNDEIEGISYVQ